MTDPGVVLDCIAIGGGPAGAAAARLLAGWGRSVLVLARPSARGALGESVPPSCRKLLERIGIAAAVDGAGFVRTTGNTVSWGGETRTASFPPGTYGYQVERDVLDALLLANAAAAGAHVVSGATVRSVGDGDRGSGWSVRYDAAGVAHCAQARWVLDCSGRTGVVASRGWRRTVPAQRTLALIGLWERARGWDLEDASHTLVESCEDGWAWSVPLSPTRRCVAVMVDPSLTSVGGRERLAQVYAARLAKTVRCGGLVRGASPASLPWACDASAYTAGRFGEPGLLLTGDAASFVDPLSSFGVKKALASAWLAAVVVHSCLDDPAMTTPALALYAARERLMVEALQRRSVQFSRLAAGGHEFWLGRGASDVTGGAGEPDVGALRRDPDVLDAFDRLKRSGAIRLRPAGATRSTLPVVRGDRIALAEHLVSPAFPEGIRYVRDVDLVVLADMAGGFRQVPDLYEAYNRAAPPVALPDFLGALSLLVGKGLLRDA